jgi:hypothetical protein
MARAAASGTDKFKVPEKEKGELLGILGPIKPSIVGQQTAGLRGALRAVSMPPGIFSAVRSKIRHLAANLA